MFFQRLWWFVNGVLMDCASLMGSLALDLSWSHAGQTHKTTSTHILYTNWIDTVIPGIALGLIINTRTAKYLTPRLLGYAAKNTQITHKNTRIYQIHTHANQNQYISWHLFFRNIFSYWTLANIAFLCLLLFLIVLVCPSILHVYDSLWNFVFCDIPCVSKERNNYN